MQRSRIAGEREVSLEMRRNRRSDEMKSQRMVWEF
jgi:hypothetical protein